MGLKSIPGTITGKRPRVSPEMWCLNQKVQTTLEVNIFLGTAKLKKKKCKLDMQHIFQVQLSLCDGSSKYAKTS
jgi:hypothetical protein